MTLRPDIDKSTLGLVRRVDPLTSDRRDETDDEAVLRAVTEQIDALEGLEHRHHHRPRQRVLAGSTLGLAGVVAALMVALSGSGSATSPAFALTPHRDGSVSVQIYRRSGVVGANRKLASIGIHERLYAVSTSLSGLSHPQSPGGPQSCLRDQTGGLVHVIFPSAAAQRAAVGTGTYVPPSNAGNTGGPPNHDTFVVITCPIGNPGDTASGKTRFLAPAVNPGNTTSTESGNTGAG